MALDYRKCAEEIYSHLGGKDNIASAAHCATRLRLAIVDNSKVDVKAIENTEGVQGVFNSNGQLQIIIGTGTVNKVYDEFIAVSGVSAGSKDDVKAAAAANMPWWKRAVKTLGDVFVPILPAIVAAGLMNGIVNALGLAIPSFNGSDWYQFLTIVSGTAFSFLPVLVAMSASKVFGGNIYLGAVIGLMMVHPDLTNAWSLGDAEPERWYLLGKVIHFGSYYLGQVNKVGYQGHVIPVVIAIWLMSTLEKWLHKHVPEMIDLFVTPLTTVMVTALATFMVIGPIFSALETLVLNGAKWLVGNPIGAAAMGALYPVTVVMGLHHMYNTIEAGMVAQAVPMNTWMPIASAANFAQFGACLAVGLKTKDKHTKSLAVPASLSASLGITEPAIFGVNLRFMKPFVCAMIGGAAGAFVGALTGCYANAYGVTGLPGYLIIRTPLSYTFVLAVSFALGFILCFITFKDNKEVEEEGGEEPEIEEKDVITTEKGNVAQPVAGKVIPASEIADPMFAQETMGPSVGIEPAGSTVVAPFDGKVTMLFPTKHAVGVTSKDGVEVLIHIGIDTVNMNGDGFEAFVQQDDEITKGQKLIHFDRRKIKEAGHPDTVIVVVTNGAEFKDLKKAA